MPDQLVQSLLNGPLYGVILGVVFVGVVGTLMSVAYMVLSRTSAVQDRLERSVLAVSSATQKGGVVPSRAEAPRTALGRLAEAVSRMARPHAESEIVGLRGRLGYAGFRRERALTVYLVSQVVLCVAAGMAVTWYLSRAPQEMERMAIATILAMATGFYLPPLWLRGRIHERQRAINHALPDALDLTITCVEAGMGIDAALDRVSQEVGLSANLLAEELGLTSREIRAGIPRGEAFRRLARRTGVEELRSLAAVIVQTELFGTAIGQTLRVQADSMRVRRTFVAEERAGKVAVKLTIPLVLCILPALLTVLVGPAVLAILRVLLPTLGGQ